MPHISIQLGKPIHERTGWQLISAFVIVPTFVAIILLSLVGWMIAQHRTEFSRGDWFGVGWAALVAVVLVVGLPTAAWREWQRRKQFGHSEQDG